MDSCILYTCTDVNPTSFALKSSSTRSRPAVTRNQGIWNVESDVSPLGPKMYTFWGVILTLSVHICEYRDISYSTHQYTYVQSICPEHVQAGVQDTPGLNVFLIEPCV